MEWYREQRNQKQQNMENRSRMVRAHRIFPEVWWSIGRLSPPHKLFCQSFIVLTLMEAFEVVWFFFLSEKDRIVHLY